MQRSENALSTYRSDRVPRGDESTCIDIEADTRPSRSAGVSEVGPTSRRSSTRERLGPAIKDAAIGAAARQRSGPNRLEITNHPISRLVSSLSVLVGQVVIDRTGLTGSYDLVLEFSPELPGVPGPQRPLVDSNLPSIFIAIQEQLGLKLAPSRGPVPVLVVERAETPTED